MRRRRRPRSLRAGSASSPGAQRRASMPMPPARHDAHRERRDEQDRLQLVGEEVEQMPGLRRQLLEAREHPVRAVEAVAQLEDGDGREPAAPGRQRDEQRRGHDEQGQVQQRQLVGRDPRGRDGGHDDRGHRPHDVDIEELIVLLACLPVHARGRAQHSASSGAYGRPGAPSRARSAWAPAPGPAPMTTLLPRHSLELGR